MSDTYSMPYECHNCMSEGSLDIPKGREIGPEVCEECPNCGCKTAKITKKKKQEFPWKPQPYRTYPPTAPKITPPLDITPKITWCTWR